MVLDQRRPIQTATMSLRCLHACANPMGPPTMVSRDEFISNLNIFSEGCLSCLTPEDWQGVLVAGGSVLTALTSVPKEHQASRRALRRFYHEDPVNASSDIDLFLYGMDQAAAEKKIVRLGEAIADAVPLGRAM